MLRRLGFPSLSRQCAQRSVGARTLPLPPRYSVRAHSSSTPDHDGISDPAGSPQTSYSHPELDPKEGELWALPEGWATHGRQPSAGASPLGSYDSDGMCFPRLREEMMAMMDKPGIDLLASGPAIWSAYEQVYTIVFSIGGDVEGVYSLHTYSEDGLPQETILVFEEQEDAERYASLLEATMERAPSVCPVAPRDIVSLCQERGYQCCLEQRGSLLFPPDTNVRDTDWERSRRLRAGRWTVLEAEPEHVKAAGASAPASPSRHPGSGSSTSGSSYSTLISHDTLFPQPQPQQMGGAAAAAIRQQLESLLPPDDSPMWG